MRMMIYLVITIALFAYDPVSFLNYALVRQVTDALVDVVQPTAPPLPENFKYAQKPVEVVSQLPVNHLESIAGDEGAVASESLIYHPEEIVRQVDELLHAIENENKDEKL